MRIFHFIRNRNKREVCAWNIQWCRSNCIVNQHLFRDYVRIPSSAEEKGWVCGHGKSGNLIQPIFRRRETRRNDRQSRRIRSREQKWVHRFEYRNCSEKATEAVWRRKRKEKEGYMWAKRTDIKRKLEQKMTVVIYRHKFAIRRVFFGLRAKKGTKKGEEDCDS